MFEINEIGLLLILELIVLLFFSVFLEHHMIAVLMLSIHLQVVNHFVALLWNISISVLPTIHVAVNVLIDLILKPVPEYS